MRLAPKPIAQFERDGVLFCPGLFGTDEVKALTDAAPAGSMSLFQPCLGTASSRHPSPSNRVGADLGLCAVASRIRRFERPEDLAHRDFSPIDRLPDGRLPRPYPADLTWKDGMPASALATSPDPIDVPRKAA